MDHRDADKAALVQAHQLDTARDRIDELGDHLTDLEARQRADRARLDDLTATSAALLARLGVTPAAAALASPHPAATLSPATLDAIERTLPTFEPVATVPFDSWTDYRRHVDAYVELHHLDLDTDPLLQLLGPHRVAEVERRFHADFGDTRWTRWDYTAVAVAAALTTLVDLVLVRIPSDMNFLGVDYTGSPVTRLLRDTADRMTNGASDSPLLQWLEHTRADLEGWAKVTYDLSTNSKARGIAIDGLRPATHRLMSPGHDPALGFVVGTLENLAGVCTLIDRTGHLHVLASTTHQRSFSITGG